MQDLKKGYSEFRANFEDHKKLFEDLVENGQHPKTFFVTCSDSRVVPSLITNTTAGDLFVARNIGNFVPPFDPQNKYPATEAALEYAVSALKVENIVICAHSECGAIATLFKDIKADDTNIHIVNWLALGKEAKDKANKEMQGKSLAEIRDFTEKVNAVIQLKNLLTYPAVKQRVESGELKLYAWHYNIKTGEILCYDEEKQEYLPLNS